ncbi:MAG: hypothetical protein JWN30_2745, partial [Bacilli bacterium]|nr:hypothetical protein [Bacilli bacterium]
MFGIMIPTVRVTTGSLIGILTVVRGTLSINVIS